MFKTLSLALALCICLAACQGGKANGPELGTAARGPMLDKSGDTELARLVADVAPKFIEHTFMDGSRQLTYSLFVPEKMEIGKKYPLVLFMADASTAGRDARAHLTQGYGALVWGTKAAQAKNPCFILVPQFPGVAVNDAYQHTPEVDKITALVKDVIKNNAIDPSRVYTTGQSMGGMISMYLTTSQPDLFAAALFVDCHWDSASFDALVRHPFVFINAGNSGKSAVCRDEIEEAARKEGVSYAWMEWSAKLPQQTQDELAATLLGKGQPINLITFESGSVLPADGKGSEHMYSFDYAYKLAPVREWLFTRKLAQK